MNIRSKKSYHTGSLGGSLWTDNALKAAFFIPVVIMVIIFFARGIFPFGEETFLRTDMYHQYAPFFSEFQYKLQNGGSLLYSWDIGMGVNFAALYAYYLASPLNWLVILVPKAYILEFMTYMIVLKIGLSSLSMAWYLRKSLGTRDFGVAAFGIFYGLSGYMAAYSWNIMWLDCILLFPLVIYGLEKLVKEGRGLMYSLCLGLCILSNYYISYMICIFMVIYFVAMQIILRPYDFREFTGRILRFAFFSLLAGGFAAVTLIPEAMALQSTASASVNFPQTFTRYFTVIDMFARHMVNVETEQGLNHWPNIYCGVAVIMLFAVYMLTKKISVREKAVYCSMLFIFFVSFAVNVLNFIWHGFHYPNSLPCRQSFIYIFLMLYMCYRVYMNLGDISMRNIGAGYLFSITFVLICEKTVTAKHFHFSVFYLSIVFISLYALLIYLWKRRRIGINTAIILLISFITIENTINTAVTSITTTSRTAYTEDNEDVITLVDSLVPSSEFFRVEKNPVKTKNDGAWMNYPSVSLFSSVANADITDFFKAVGCEGSTNAYALTGSTPLMNMLFSVKYSIYDAPQNDGEGKRFLESIENTWLYENNYSLSVGFMMPQGMSGWALDFDDPALVQDDLCRALGTDAVLVPNETLGDENGGTYTVTIGDAGEYYTYIKNPGVKDVSVEKDGVNTKVENVDRGYFVELGECSRGEVITIRSETDGQDIMAETYRFDYGALKQVYSKLSQNELQLTSWTDSSLRGNIDAGVGGIMFTSIPYDEGWKVLVDGEEVIPQKLFDSFMGIALTSGEHYIELSYMPEGLLEGAVISLISVGIMLIIFLVGIIRRRSEDDYGYDDPYQDPELEEGFFDELSDEPDLEKEAIDTEDIEKTDTGTKAGEPKNGEKKSSGILDELSEELGFDFSKTKNELMDRLESMEDIDEPENSFDGREKDEPKAFTNSKYPQESREDSLNTDEIIERFMEEKSKFSEDISLEGSTSDELSELTGKLSRKGRDQA